MKPIIILPDGAMSEDNMKLLRENGICVVTAKDPAQVKFVDPLPAVSSRTQIEHAALQLSRKLLNTGAWNTETFYTNDGEMRKCIATMFFDILAKGTPLSKDPTPDEIETSAYNTERIAEMRRLAQKDAKEEHAAKKAAKTAESKAGQKASSGYEKRKEELGIAVKNPPIPSEKA